MKKKYPVIDTYKTGQNIKRIMLARGLTVRDVQEFLELAAPQSIYHWFDGRSLPTIDNLYALSELFRMPMDELVCGSRRKEFCFFEHPKCRRFVTYYKKCMEIMKLRVCIFP